MKTYKIELTQAEIDALGNLIGDMGDTMGDIETTRPGGILPTPKAFKRYINDALIQFNILHDKIMDDVIGVAVAIEDDDQETKEWRQQIEKNDDTKGVL